MNCPESVATGSGPQFIDDAPVAGTQLLVRQTFNPYEQASPDANHHYWGWQRHPSRNYDSVLAVDAFVAVDDELTHVGHIDWAISGDYANGGGNVHQGFIPKDKHEELAKEACIDDVLALRVQEAFQGRGLGSLMLATSAVALHAAGVTRFYSGGMLEPAQQLYGRFGIRKADFPSGHAHDKHLPIERLIEPSVAYLKN